MSDATRMTGGEAVAATLEALGVAHVFGIVSVHNIPIYDVIATRGAITTVSVRHEQAAVHAADGYARATGRLGVAIASTGPGTANAMGGLFEASFASSPVLLITGQVESRYYGQGRGFLHEAENQTDMLRSVTRRTESVRRTEEIPDALARVARDCLTGRRRPGAVEIPVDLQYRVAEVTIPDGLAAAALQPDEAALDEAAAVLRAAVRPLIWAGGGVIAADAAEPLRRLATHLGAPVLTTVTGRGALPEDDPLCLGPFTAHPLLQPVLEEADVLLAAGTRFQGGATRNWSLRLPDAVVHVDADPSVIGRSYAVRAAVVGDAHLALDALAERVTDSKTDPSFAERAAEAAAAARAAGRQLIGPDHEAIMDCIREVMPDDGVVARDSTVPAYLWADRLLPILRPRTSIHPTGAAIGPGLPLAIGAALGSGRPTVLVQGDGGLMLSIGELATAAQYRVPLAVCVFNDKGYGVLRSIQARTFEGRQTGVDLLTPDFAALAEAMGIPGRRVESVDGFRAAFAEAVQSGGPFLLDIDMNSLQPMGAFSARRPA